MMGVCVCVCVCVCICWADAERVGDGGDDDGSCLSVVDGGRIDGWVRVQWS